MNYCKTKADLLGRVNKLQYCTEFGQTADNKTMRVLDRGKKRKQTLYSLKFKIPRDVRKCNKQRFFNFRDYSCSL